MKEVATDHSDVLYHYTGKGGLEVLLEIMKNGFKFGYCEEFLPRNRFVAFPMLCFCDIPIELSKEHRGKYGEFGIGVSKKYMVEHFKDWFGPVNYVISYSAIEAAFTIKDLVEEKKQYIEVLKSRGMKNGEYISLNGNDGMDIITQSLEFIDYHKKAIASIALMKLYESENGNIINYDECEWRMFIPENGKYRGIKEKCEWFWDKEEFKVKKEEKGEVIALGKKKLFFDGYKLTLPMESIEKIVVPDDKNKRFFMSEIRTSDFIMGREATEKDKSEICSKVVVACTGNDSIFYN